MTAVVSFVNQKGGVGKTSVTLGMASAALVAGHRVLVLDLDPQASSTWILGLEPGNAGGSILEASRLARRGAVAELAVESGWAPEVHIVPGDPAMHGEEDLGLVRRLRKSMAGIGDEYDIVLIDTAPSLGALTTAALAVSTHVVMVAEPAALSLRGVAAVADFIDLVWEKHNQQLELAGVVVNRVPAVSAEADRQLDDLTRHVGKKAVWQPYVPSRVVVPQAASERSPIHGYGARAADVTDAFDQLYAKLCRATKR
jgi:chromosome partitioning protein